MSLGYFEKTDAKVKGLQNNISKKTDLGDVPEKQKYLKKTYEETMMVLESTNVSGKAAYITQIDEIVEKGLIGNDVDTSRAIHELDIIRDKIAITEGKKLKESYIIKLGKWSLVLGLIPLIIGLMVQSTVKDTSIIRYVNLWAGCMAGTWISYTARRVSLDFKDLHICQSDQLEPLLKLLFIGISTIFLFLIIETQLINISFGKVDKGMMKDIRVVFLFGGFCGLLDSRIPTTLYKKAGTTLKF